MGDEPLQVDCVGAGQLGEEAREAGPHPHLYHGQAQVQV